MYGLSTSANRLEREDGIFLKIGGFLTIATIFYAGLSFPRENKLVALCVVLPAALVCFFLRVWAAWKNDGNLRVLSWHFTIPWIFGIGFGVASLFDVVRSPIYDPVWWMVISAATYFVFLRFIEPRLEKRYGCTCF